MNIIEPVKTLITQGVEYALTLWPEWQFPIVVLDDKRVENRGWPPPAKMVGRSIALHWGAHVGGRKGFTAKREGCSAMLRTAVRAGWHVEGSLFSAILSKDGKMVTFNADELLTRAIGCIIRITSVTRPGPLRADDPYYLGEHGWRFDVLENLATPIPCSGAQGLWPLRSLLGEEVGPPQAGRQW